MANAREELDLIVDKFAQQIVIANGEVLNATNLTIAVDYLERTPQVRKVDEHLQALEIIVKKGVDKKNLLESNNFREYNKNLLDTYRGTTYFKNEHNLKYTEKEYDLVSRVVKEITENDSKRNNR